MNSWVLHPFLLATYRILALYSTNIHEARPAELILPIAVAVGSAAVLWGMMALLLRSGAKAGVLASIGVVCFLGWGPFIDISNRCVHFMSTFWVPFYEDISLVKVLACWSILWLVVASLVVWKMKNGERVTKLLNIFSLCLLAMPIASIVFARPTLKLDPAIYNRVATPLATLDTRQEERPDIYYIVLDSYARGDVMKALFDVDNSPFIEGLERRGFYVPKHSIANYAQTRLCLSSSLNGRYLDDLFDRVGNDQTNLAGMIGQSDFLETLRPLGYRFAAFSSGFQETEHQEADLYLTPPSKIPFSGFQRLLVSTTPCSVLLPAIPEFDRYEHIRERVLYTLQHLADVADDPAPTFTLAHFLSPHPPFLFGVDGEDVANRDDAYYVGDNQKYVGTPTKKWIYYRGYREQAIYLTKRIEKTIDEILARSKTPPIIIVQGDHGAGLNLDMESREKTDIPERMMILNAYYFPNKKYEGLYDKISPVNSFRVLLNTYFGTKLEMLPDKSYFSTWSQAYEFHDVTDEVTGRDYPSNPDKSWINDR